MYNVTKNKKRVVLKIEKRRKNAENRARGQGDEEKGGQEESMDERGHGADAVGASHFYLVCGILLFADVRLDYCF